MGATPAKMFVGSSAYDRAGESNLLKQAKQLEPIEDPQLPAISGLQGNGDNGVKSPRVDRLIPGVGGGIPGYKADLYENFRRGDVTLPRPKVPLRRD